MRSSTIINLTKTKSPTHEYDLCLSSFITAFEIRSQAYRREGNSLPEKDRPDPAVFKNCLNSDARRDLLSDDEIDDIAERWRRLKLLQRLYLDPRLTEEFEAWRSAFVSDLSAGARAEILRPGINTTSNAASMHEQSQRYGPDFKGRFYKSLCLNTIAVASLQLARTCREVPRDGPELGVNEDISDATLYLWTRSRVFVNGSGKDLHVCTKADNLEVFDFLYMFLLPKLVHSFEWNMDIGFYDDMEGLSASKQEWLGLLEDCRRCIRPSDLIDLIQHETWNSPYPHDKYMYLYQRGMFDDGESGSFDWYTFLNRADILDGLLPMSDLRLNSTTTKSPSWWNPQTTESPSWWDRLRRVVGSPFGEGFEDKYEAEVGKLLEQRDSK